MAKPNSLFAKISLAIFLLSSFIPQTLATEIAYPDSWSQIDWQQNIVQLQDLYEYQEKFQELELNQDWQSLKNLRPTVTKISDLKTLPTQDNQKTQFIPEVKIEKFDGSTVKKIHTVPAFRKPEVKVLSKPEPTQKKTASPLTFFGIPLLPQAYADNQAAIIELGALADDSARAALYFIAQQQNEDGSFGEQNKIVNTAKIITLLEQLNRTENLQYPLATNFLQQATPQNNREIFAKHQHTCDQQLPPVNSDGGFSLTTNHLSDPITTISAINALTACNQQANPDLSSALLYLINDIPVDGGLHFDTDANPSFYLINQTAQALYPYREQVLVNNNQEYPLINYTSALTNYLTTNFEEQSSKDQTATLATFHLFDLQEQDSLTPQVASNQYFNGSFFNQIESTIQGINALKKSDAILSNLQVQGALTNRQSAQFTIDLSNNGEDYLTKGSLHIFVDDYLLPFAYALEEQELSLAPGETTTLQINFPDTASFFGNQNFKFYFENNRDLDSSNNWLDQDFNFAANLDGQLPIPLYQAIQNRPGNDDISINIVWNEVSDPRVQEYIVIIKDKELNQALWRVHLPPGVVNVFANSFGILEEGKVYQAAVGTVDQNGNWYGPEEWTTFTASIHPENFAAQLTGQINFNNQPGPYLQTFANQSGNTTSDEQGNFTYQQAPNGSTLVSVSEGDQYEQLLTKVEVPANGLVEGVAVHTRLTPDDQPPVINNLEIQAQGDFHLFNQHPYRIIASTQDNIRTRDVSFFYFDPQSDLWHYLGTQLSDANTFALDWQVPAELSGQGFQIKAIAFDYQGNQSDEATWGPFEIADGTPPEFDLIVPNGGEVWQLGSDQQITWNIEQVNGIANLDLHLKFPNSDSEYLIASEIANTGSYNWTIPENYNLVGEQLKVHLTGDDGADNITYEDYSDATFSIINNQVDNDPWPISELIIDQLAFANPNCLINEFALDYNDQNTPTLIFKCSEDFRPLVNVINQDFYYTQYSAGQWQAPQLIYSDSQQVNNDLSNFKNITDLQYIDNGATKHLIWMTRGSNCQEHNQQEIYNLSYQNGAWVEPQNISNNNSVSQSPQLQSDSQNNPHVAWLDGPTYDQACNRVGSYQLHHATYQNAAWATEELNQLPSIDLYNFAITNNDNLHFIYRDYDNSAASHVYGQNNNWSNPVPVTDQPVTLRALTAGINANDLHYSYYHFYQNPGRTAVAYNYFDGNQWQPQEETTPTNPPHQFSQPINIVDSSGRPHVFALDNAQNGTNYNFAWNYKADQIWQAGTQANLTSQILATAPEDKTVAISNDDHLGAAWIGDNQALPNIFFSQVDINNLDLTAPPEPPLPETEDLLNLINDGNMEAANRDAWRNYGQPAQLEKTTDQAVSGTQSIYINTLGSGGGVQQTSIPVKANNIYTLTFKYKILNGQMRTLLGINTSNSDYDNGLSIINHQDEEWHTFRREFEMPADFDGSLNLVVSTRDAEIYLDDVRITLSSPNLINDGNMEEPTMEAWRNYGQPAQLEKTSSQAISGTQSIYINTLGSGGGVQQTSVPVTADKWYELSFKYKILNGQMRTLLGINTSNSDYDGGLSIINHQDAEWHTFRREFQMPADFDGSLNLVVSTRDADMYLDNVRIIEISPGSLIDGDMEAADRDAWINYGQPTLVEKTTTQSSQGSQSLHIQSLGTRGGVQQIRIPNQPGATYTVTLDYQGTSGYFIPIIGLGNSNADYQSIATRTYPTDQWQTYERTFTLPDPLPGDLRIVIQTDDADLYIDNVNLIQQ